MYPSYNPTTLPTSLETDYFQGFEEHSFSFAGEDNPVWLTTNEIEPDLVWTRTEEEAIGIFSLKSPVLDNEMKTPSSAKLTLILPDNTGGALHFSVKAGSQMPFDLFDYSVNGVSRGSVTYPMSDFEEIVVQLKAGAHVIDFVYKFNPQNIPALGLPPVEAFPNRTGLVYVDNVYFIPRSSIPPVTRAPAAPTLKPTNYPTVSRAPSSCAGSTLDWRDSYGDGCDWYEAHDSPGCPLFGNDCLSGVDCDGNIGVANDNCCWCMGTGAPSVAPSLAPSVAPSFSSSPTFTQAPTHALEEITCGSVVIDSTIGLDPISMPICSTSDGSGGAKLYKLVGTGEMTTLSTCGEWTDYDTKIRVYQKEASDDICVTGNDDSCGLSSIVEFVAESGVEYNVLVDGYNSGQGTYMLSVACGALFV